MSAETSDGVHGDVARPVWKDIPTCSTRYAISAGVDYDLLVALVKTRLAGTAGGFEVRSGSIASF
jgi:hypothetical protein